MRHRRSTAKFPQLSSLTYTMQQSGWYRPYLPHINPSKTVRTLDYETPLTEISLPGPSLPTSFPDPISGLRIFGVPNLFLPHTTTITFRMTPPSLPLRVHLATPYLLCRVPKSTSSSFLTHLTNYGAGNVSTHPR